MAFLGLQEILLIFFSIVLLVVTVVTVAVVVYLFTKGYREKRDERIKALEARVDQFEKDKTAQERMDSVEKRFNEQQGRHNK